MNGDKLCKEKASRSSCKDQIAKIALKKPRGRKDGQGCRGAVVVQFDIGHIEKFKTVIIGPIVAKGDAFGQQPVAKCHHTHQLAAQKPETL